MCSPQSNDNLLQPPTEGLRQQACPTTARPLSTSKPPVAAGPVKKKKQQKHPNNVVQHNYHDHAGAPTPQHFRMGPVNTFPLKLFVMLERVQEEELEHIVSWQPHGRCFLVHNIEAFTQLLLPRFFKITKMPSFQRQLNLWGFSRITKGPDRNGYYHELFLRGKPFLVSNVARSKVKGNRIRAKANPEQEPNFWAMTCVDVSDSGIRSDNMASCASAVKLAPVGVDLEPIPLSQEPDVTCLRRLGSLSGLIVENSFKRERSFGSTAPVAARRSMDADKTTSAAQEDHAIDDLLDVLRDIEPWRI